MKCNYRHHEQRQQVQQRKVDQIQHLRAEHFAIHNADLLGDAVAVLVLDGPAKYKLGHRVDGRRHPNAEDRQLH